MSLLSDDYGSGDGAISYVVEPNPHTATRSAILSMAGANLTIHQAGAGAGGSMTLVGVPVVDAEYSRVTDQITYVTAQPPRLRVFDPATKTERSAPLVRSPLSVAVRPDGAYAAVGHDGWVSYVNLETAAVEQVIPVITDVGDIVLAANGYMYLFPRRDWSDIYSYEISSGKLTPTGAIYMGRTARPTPDGNYIYATSSSWFSKWDLRDGIAKSFSRSSTTSSCGNIWMAEDGRRAFTACARVYRSSDAAEQDMEYNGSLANVSYVQWADHSGLRQTVAVIPSSLASSDGAPVPPSARIQLYSDAFLGYEGAVTLPMVVDGDNSYFAQGRWVFWSRDGERLYVILDAATPADTQLGSAITIVSPNDTREISVAAVVNSASGTRRSISPGELISIFGTGMGPEEGVSFAIDPETGKVNTTLGKTSVFFGSTAAPILYSSSTQVNAIVPFSSSGRLWVVHDGLPSAAVDISSASVSPGVFTMDGSGAGQAAATNHPDGSIADASHPASPGSYVTLYFTGGGRTSPSGETGAIAGPQPRRFQASPTVTVGGVRATVTYAGVAPGLVEGVGQINIQLAQDTPAGDAVPVVISYGQGTNQVSSQPDATIAVR